ncbi:MAG: glucose-6-phosphate isomerase [Prochlorococcus sp. SP3034]|nr:glucose-6-phosphate isomerase [Prochlorococcus sp. SP3034]|tara:strand:- start:11444 stop:13048 length:1605 start_codon:yes stop_codon:yes gene_type:complete
MISSQNNSNHDNLNDWEKFSNYLWFDKDINIWLDISKVIFNDRDINEIKREFKNVFKATKDLEEGAISNIDENRQVGHYWLRNSNISPDIETKNTVNNDIKNVEEFSRQVINKSILNKKGQPFTDVLWIGIGGSALGPLLIIEALQNESKGLNFSFIDNIDPFLIKEKLEFLKGKLETTLFVVVSKSGGTPEPKIAMNIIRKNIESNNIDWPSQSIAITMNNSKLHKKASSENWLKTFNLPDWVGGRTSITSSVGLLPLGLIEEGINDFLNGASIMDQITRDNDFLNNPSALLASSWFLCGNGEGKRDMVVLPYRDRLQVFSKYLQQLVMESLGKKMDRSGKIVNQGISVFGNKGSTDQHAYVQQLRDGIDNFFCIFIELLDAPDNLKIFNLDNPKDYLSGFMQGTRSALSNQGRQSITITLKELNAFTLGALIALFERAVTFYAELVNINAYDQPGVEAGKKAAADVISSQLNLQELLLSGDQFTFKEIVIKMSNTSPETIFFILRQMCFSNSKYKVDGSWSDPESLLIQRIK